MDHLAEQQAKEQALRNGGFEEYGYYTNSTRKVNASKNKATSNTNQEIW